MGYLDHGIWKLGSPSFADADGSFRRAESSYRNWVTADGRPGPSGRGGFRAEPDRYHLYVSLACPWAHRTLIMRALKGLTGLIGVSVVNPYMGEDGWTFASGEGVVPDPLYGSAFLRDLYVRSNPEATGRVTVPVLWDKETGTIVNNESSEIIRMLNSAFDGIGAAPGDYYPAALRTEIDAVNARVYETVNNGVYKAGFATRQGPYERAVIALFESLDWLEERLGRSRYLMGTGLTEADIRLYTTLARFDAVYVGHFKCNLRRLVDYPALWAYMRDLYQTPGFGETTDFGHIKQHYYLSHASIDPTGIVPLGPIVDWDAPHSRGRLAA